MSGRGPLKHKRCANCRRHQCGVCPLFAQQSAPGSRVGEKPRPVLAIAADIIYLYDGSIEGLLCCVYQSVYAHELPVNIEAAQQAQPSLLPQKLIITEPDKATKVYASIPQKICVQALALIEHVFFSCMPEKEIAILRFLLFAYQEGKSALYMLGHPLVAPLLAAEKHLLGERQLLLGFIRFSDYGEVLAATISPKNFVLPYLSAHFIGRFGREDFMIYDKVHQAALIYQKGQQQIIHLENVVFPDVPEAEEQYRSLWKQFYKTIAIEARENPRCRMTHMPKRYWQNMTEMQEYL